MTEMTFKCSDAEDKARSIGVTYNGGKDYYEALCRYQADNEWTMPEPRQDGSLAMSSRFLNKKSETYRFRVNVEDPRYNKVAFSVLVLLFNCGCTLAKTALKDVQDLRPA
ncbi:hypothetical protein AURDEDRAFT_164121 [Auricularia subglabra TFB-10046 SS5]|nr:hypothetical protein AURDEDRAFT_164121 [Auricularia subglabra TFB-10046 SS5]